MKNRQGLIVWLYSTQNQRQLRRHGYVYYVSESMNYAIMYVDKEIAEETVEEIKRYHFVRDVEYSPRDNIDMTFENAIDDPTDVDLIFASKDEEKSDDFFQKIAESIQSGLKDGESVD